MEILIYGSDIPVSFTTIVSLVGAAGAPIFDSNFPSPLLESSQDAGDGVAEPTAGGQVEEVCWSNVPAQLLALPSVPDHLHTCIV